MIFGLGRPGGKRIPPKVMPGSRVYAVGDVHGRADLLAEMAGLVEADLRRARPDRALTVFLGDYVDRGADSAAVLDRLARGTFPTPLVALRGNHDAILLDLLDTGIDLGWYGQLGGEATLRSYGLALDDLAWMGEEERRAALLAAIPASHVDFVRGTALSHVVDDYFFCHAGVRPGVPLEAQQEEDLLWIRAEFHRSTEDFGKTVVHGHTPVSRPEIRVNAVNVDTRAFSSGILTALVLEGATQAFLQTG